MNSPMTFGSLFTGIGGFDLGLERAGMKCRFQVEIDPYCQRVLSRHWPEVGRWDDVQTFLQEGDPDLWKVDLICGGFPCQDLSVAGKGAGIDGPRSGLWREFARIIGLVRPGWVVLENVPMLVRRGLGRVLTDLARLGYSAEWEVVSAASFGAPHIRRRLFLVAYPDSLREPQPKRIFASGWRRTGDSGSESSDVVADTCRQRCGEIRDGNYWKIEPAVGRVVDGVPNRVDRLRGLGNALIPQIAEAIGRRILAVREQ